MRLLRTALLLMGLWGCASESSQLSTDEVLRRDSAGVEIVQVPGELLDGLPVWRLSLDPVLVLGSADGDGPDVFGSISSVVALPARKLAVVDGRAGEIKIFDEAGAFLRRIGGTGQGPGEFAQTPIVRPHALGGLVTFDWSLGRFTVFDSLGNVLETTRWDPATCSFVPLGGESAIACVPRGLLSNENALVALDERPSLSPDLVGQDFSNLGTTVGLASSSGYVELARVPYSPIGVRFERGPEGAERVTLTTPILAPTPITTSGAAHVAVGRDDAYELRIFDDRGKLVRILRVLREGASITDAEKAMLMNYDPPLTSLPAESGVAPRRPVISASTRFGDGEDLWIPDFRFAPLTGPDRGSMTTIFGVDGSPVARLAIPPNPIYHGQRAGADAGSSRDHYRVVTRDSLGVQRLLIFQIEKGP